MTRLHENHERSDKNDVRFLLYILIRMRFQRVKRNLMNSSYKFLNPMILPGVLLDIRLGGQDS